tara:strand:- start:2119 stop:2265 length:147 start_codon:yes stop_codon:yes gene_type:complete
MNTIKVWSISVANYFVGLSEIHEMLQIVVSALSIIALILTIKGKKNGH